MGGAFTEIAINILRQRTILECISVLIVSGQGVNLELVHFTINEVVESAVLPAGLALVPVVNLCEAHTRSELLCLDAVYHALVESVAGMSLQRH